MTSRIVLPGTVGYDELRRPEIPRFAAMQPAAVVPCATPQDVADALAYARSRALPLAVRGGGHDFAGRSTTEGVLIDVRPMAGVTVAGDRAVVGGGARLGDVYDALFAYGRTIPAGCGPTVGIGGLALHGGLGILGRTYGLTCDSLRAATVVLGDGRTVACDAEREPDLFWALRGGGAPGVVTALEFAIVPAPDSTAFRLGYPAGSGADVLEGWQRFAPPADDAIAASLVLSTSSDLGHAPAVTVFGAVIGDTAALDDLVGKLAVRPASDQRWPGTHRDTKRRLADTDPHEGPMPADGFTYLRSEYFRSAVPAAELVRALAADRRAGEFRELDFSPWAGAYNRVPVQATAFPHRDAQFLLKHSATVAPHAEPTPWLDASFAITHPYGTGGTYPNFPEPGLPDSAYYGVNTPRLHAVRAAYDPEGRFAAI
jgi:FAD/FMN-containing dehydrogenase